MAVVTRVDALPVLYPEPNDSNALRSLLFVRLETDGGEVGWGEAISQFPASSLATAALVDGLSHLILGTDPLDNLATWRRLRDQTWWFGYRGGLMNFALSAIDIALWDLRGHVTGLSLSTMIGRRPDLDPRGMRALASTHVFDADLDYEVDRHARYVGEGYLGVKIGMGKKGDARLGYDVKRDIKFVDDLRAACGSEAWIMMDRGQSLVWTLDDTIRRVQAWQEADLKWVEEPFEPWEFDKLRVLRNHSTCLIAGGEREWDARGFEEALAPGVLDVVGCDVGRVGGITGALQVIRLVEQRDVWFNSHAWSSAINTAASIALSASTKRCLIQELKPDPNPMQDEIVRIPFRAVDGWIAIPDSPGLGITVDDDAVRRYLIER
ncbi:MAG: mandelate racemase/muconate lactonizing enzyme family protein [Actinobacteria bacterium]|nr:mandelate racemase/muconate lactonizing enzyme family protein [Actinomycetota bacterium]